VSTVPITVCINDCYPRNCVEFHTPSDLFHRSSRYPSVEFGGPTCCRASSQ